MLMKILDQVSVKIGLIHRLDGAGVGFKVHYAARTPPALLTSHLIQNTVK